MSYDYRHISLDDMKTLLTKSQIAKIGNEYTMQYRRKKAIYWLKKEGYKTANDAKKAIEILQLLNK